MRIDYIHINFNLLLWIHKFLKKISAFIEKRQLKVAQKGYSVKDYKIFMGGLQ